jgi:murein L,D-transpeptidase YafK
MSNPPPNEPRRHDVRRGIVGVLIIGLVGALVFIAFERGFWADADVRIIETTRAVHLARARLALPLRNTPDLADLDGRLAARGVAMGAPVLIRIFKLEFELEVWMLKAGRYVLFETYPICRWSGWLGPKVRRGDRQAPEGFYTVSAAQMNPHSRWHRSFDVGFPNAFDRSFGRTGSALMVHGGCSSAGCYAMTNPVIDEIWQLTTAALRMRPVVAATKVGQERFQVQIFPFRMTAAALDKHTASPHIDLWRQLKQGYDLFEQSGLPPMALACAGTYRFSPGLGADPALPDRAQCATPALRTDLLGKKAL